MRIASSQMFTRGQAALPRSAGLVALALVAVGCGGKSGSVTYEHTYASAGADDGSVATQVATSGSDTSGGGTSTTPSDSASTGSTPVAPFSSAPLVAVNLTSTDAESAVSTSGAALLAGLDPTLCIDATSTPQDGVAPKLNACGNQAAQGWALSEGRLTIGSGKCLGLADATGGSAAPLLAPCDNTADAQAALQIWHLTGSMLRNDAANTCLTAASTTLAAGTKLAMFPCDAKNSLQKWGLGNNATSPGGSVITIGARWGWLSDTANCLDTEGGASDGNVVVRLWQCNTYDAQRWFLRAGQMTHDNRCLTAAGGQMGAAIDTRTCAESAAAAFQAWDFYRGALQLSGTDLCACVVGDPTSHPQLTLQACEAQGQIQAACRWAPGVP